MKEVYKHSEETKKKIGLASLGRKHTEEEKKKMSLHNGYSMLGKHHSEETKRKMSLARKGKSSPKTSGENAYQWKGGISDKTRKKYAPRPKPEQCEVCGAMGDICLDHDHSTNKFRGWICRRCNFALSMVKDNKEILQNLIKYLENN